MPFYILNSLLSWNRKIQVSDIHVLHEKTLGTSRAVITVWLALIVFIISICIDIRVKRIHVIVIMNRYGPSPILIRNISQVILDFDYYRSRDS